MREKEAKIPTRKGRFEPNQPNQRRISLGPKPGRRPLTPRALAGLANIAARYRDGALVGRQEILGQFRAKRTGERSIQQLTDLGFLERTNEKPRQGKRDRGRPQVYFRVNKDNRRGLIALAKHFEYSTISSVNTILKADSPPEVIRWDGVPSLALEYSHPLCDPPYPVSDEKRQRMRQAGTYYAGRLYQDLRELDYSGEQAKRQLTKRISKSREGLKKTLKRLAVLLDDLSMMEGRWFTYVVGLPAPSAAPDWPLFPIISLECRMGRHSGDEGGCSGRTVPHSAAWGSSSMPCPCPCHQPRPPRAA